MAAMPGAARSGRDQALAPVLQRRQRIQFCPRGRALHLQPGVELGVVLAFHPAVRVGQRQPEVVVDDIDGPRHGRIGGERRQRGGECEDEKQVRLVRM